LKIHQNSNCNKIFNITNIFKIQIGVETRVDGHLLLVGLKLKKYHSCREISDLEQGTTSPNILK